MSRWRVLSAYLRPNPSENTLYTAHRDRQITELTRLFSRSLAAWKNPKYNDDDRMRHLSAVMIEATDLGFWLFSQPSGFEFRWSRYEEKCLKLTTYHQSLLSVSPIFFNNHGGLASVLEETKGDDQQPCDPTIMKRLGWQDQQQRRKVTANLKRATLSQRPMSASSSLTNMTFASAVSSSNSALTGPTSSKASSPWGSDIRISYYPTTYSQSYSPTSASISPETQEVSSGSYNKKYCSHSRKSLQSYTSPDVVTDS